MRKARMESPWMRKDGMRKDGNFMEERAPGIKSSLKNLPLVSLLWVRLRRVWLKEWEKRVRFLPRHSALRRQPWTKLQLGAGSNPLNGWLNTDLQVDRDILFADAAKPLPFPSQQFEYVYTEHMIEHLTYAQGREMLREIHRVLRDGGKLRIATPDLAFLVRLYQNDSGAREQEYISWAVKRNCPELPHCSASVVNNFFQSWGHQYIYDEETLARTLLSCGFECVTRCAIGESDEPALRGLESHGRHIGEDNNRFETMVLEVRKVSTNGDGRRP